MAPVKPNHDRPVAVLGFAGLCMVCGPTHADDAPQIHVEEQESNVDTRCLWALEDKAILYQRLAPMALVRTPVLVKGDLGPLALRPRGRRAAVMDCSLALALIEAAPVFEALGLTQLGFSAAHDHRTRLGSSQLSSHALGTAIDVHSFNGTAGPHDVAKDFELGVGRWKDIAPGPGALAECVGAAITDKGRALRTLACRLKLETSFRIMVTPDDNAEHHDHFHIEYAPFARAAVAPTSANNVPPRAAPARSVQSMTDNPQERAKRPKRISKSWKPNKAKSAKLNALANAKAKRRAKAQTPRKARPLGAELKRSRSR